MMTQDEQMPSGERPLVSKISGLFVCIGHICTERNPKKKTSMCLKLFRLPHMESGLFRLVRNIRFNPWMGIHLMIGRPSLLVCDCAAEVGDLRVRRSTQGALVAAHTHRKISWSLVNENQTEPAGRPDISHA